MRDKGASTAPQGPALHLQDSITHGAVLKVERGGFRLQTGLPGRPKASKHPKLPHNQLIRCIKEQELRVSQAQAGVWGWYPAMEAPQAR